MVCPIVSYFQKTRTYPWLKCKILVIYAFSLFNRYNFSFLAHNLCLIFDIKPDMNKNLNCCIKWRCIFVSSHLLNQSIKSNLAYLPYQSMPPTDLDFTQIIFYTNTNLDYLQICQGLASWCDRDLFIWLLLFVSQRYFSQTRLCFVEDIEAIAHMLNNTRWKA